MKNICKINKIFFAPKLINFTLKIMKSDIEKMLIFIYNYFYENYK